MAASSDAASEAVSEASVEAPAAPDTPAEAVSASDTPSSETAAPAAAAAPAEEARSESPAADKPPPEYISVEDFPHSVGDVVTGRVLFSNARGARVAIHGVKGVLGCVSSSNRYLSPIAAWSMLAVWLRPGYVVDAHCASF